MKNIKEYLGSEKKDITLYHKNGGSALIYWESGTSCWFEYTFDKNGKLLAAKDSNDNWSKYTRNEDGKELTFENSHGAKRGFDIEEMTMEQVCKALGKTIKITK